MRPPIQKIALLRLDGRPFWGRSGRLFVEDMQLNVLQVVSVRGDEVITGDSSRMVVKVAVRWDGRDRDHYVPMSRDAFARQELNNLRFVVWRHVAGHRMSHKRWVGRVLTRLLRIPLSTLVALKSGLIEEALL